MGNFNRNDRDGGRRPFPRRDFDRNRGGGRGRGDRQMFKAICSNCGKSCEVPFQPTNSKPVYCSDCFEKMGGGRKDRQDRPRFDDRRPQRDNRGGAGAGAGAGANFNEQFAILGKKLDRIISLLDPQSKDQKPQQPTQNIKKDVKPETKSVKEAEPVKEEIVFIQEDNTQQQVAADAVAETPAKEEKSKKVSVKKPASKKTPKSNK